MSDAYVFVAEVHHHAEAKVRAISFDVSHWHHAKDPKVHVCFRCEVEPDGAWVTVRAFPSVTELRELGSMLLTAANTIDRHQEQLDAGWPS